MISWADAPPPPREISTNARLMRAFIVKEVFLPLRLIRLLHDDTGHIDVIKGFRTGNSIQISLTLPSLKVDRDPNRVLSFLSGIPNSEIIHHINMNGFSWRIGW